jgi:hypothetical protein
MVDQSRPVELPSGVDLADVFLVDPENESFLLGNSACPLVAFVGHPKWVLLYYAVGLSASGFILLEKVAGLFKSGYALHAALLGLGLLVAFHIYHPIWVAIDMRRAEADNPRRLLAAKILSRYHTRTQEGLRILVDYAFLTPAGREITKQVVLTSGIDSARWPEQEQKLLVLYLDDRHYGVL